jgi:ribosomal protein S18 acetylase RimI-like enzyme
MDQNYTIPGFDMVSFKHRHFTIEELSEVSELHRQEMESGFLSTLKGKLLENLYEFISNDPFSFLIIAKDKDKVVGYICGTSKIGGLYKRFIKKKFFKALLSLIPNLFSLKVIPRIVETLLYPTKREISSLPDAEIIAFAVRKEYRGTGLAHKLFDEALVCFKRLNVDSITIVTGLNQVAAQKFYEKKGAEKVGLVEVHRGVKSVIYNFRIR